MYIIKNHAGDYWSNELGWTEFIELATKFTHQQRQTLDLPLEGRWISAN